ncbi:MAG: DUF2214 family protein [Gemmatimonadales bacterium]
MLLIATGLYRAFGGIEKGTGYYLGNHLFLTKMALLGLVLVLEVGPMMTLIGWRRRLAGGAEPDTAGAARIALLSRMETAALVAMLVLATGMARGFGSCGARPHPLPVRSGACPDPSTPSCRSLRRSRHAWP